MLLRAGRQRARMGVEAFERGQQGRVNVYHSPLPLADQPWCQQPHEAGQANELDLVRDELGLQRALKGLAIAAEAAMIDDGGLDAGGASAPRPGAGSWMTA